MNKIGFKSLSTLVSLVGTVGATALLFGAGCNKTIEVFAGSTEYICSCVVGDNNGGLQQQPYFGYICADAGNAASTCVGMCSNHGGAMTDVSPGGPDMCPSGGTGGQGYRLSGAEPNSSQANVDSIVSLATVTYNGQQQAVQVGGNVAFTGGCERTSCAISFNQMYFTAANFSVRDVTGSVINVTSVHILNDGAMAGTQSANHFVIPSAQIQLLVNGYTNGVHRTAVFSPASGQDLSGDYIPSTGSFALSGHFYSSTEDLQLNLHGVATRRPPVANAGPSQGVTARSTTGTATVTLDGRGSSDLDNNLVEIRWYEGSTYLGSGTTLAVNFGVGTHTVTAEAIDATHMWNYANTMVTVAHW